MTINFAFLAFDAIINPRQSALLFNGQFTVPLVFRTDDGGGSSLARHIPTRLR
jgi:pyruvate/2-oxoglutarate/acetoin dehydrogenase E1 component